MALVAKMQYLVLLMSVMQVPVGSTTTVDPSKKMYLSGSVTFTVSGTATRADLVKPEFQLVIKQTISAVTGVNVSKIGTGLKPEATTTAKAANTTGAGRRLRQPLRQPLRRLAVTVSAAYTIETTQAEAAAIKVKTANMQTQFASKLILTPAYTSNTALKQKLGTVAVASVAAAVISATTKTTTTITIVKKTTKKAAVTTKKAVVTKKANSTNNTTRKGVVADHALPVAMLSNVLVITLTAFHCI